MNQQLERRANIMLVTAGILFGLGLCEVALRVYNPFGFRMRGNTIVLPVNQTYAIEDPNLTAFDKLDQHVTHTKNSLGFRGPEPPADFASRLTVVTIGGSTTECFYLSDSKTWPAILDGLLEKTFPGLWLNNAGLDGHSTFGHLVLMREYVGRLKPKYAMFLVGINDLFADSPRPFDRMDRTELAGFVANHSELAALALNLVRHSRTSGLKALGAMPKPINLRVPEYRDLSHEDEEALVREQQPLLQEYEQRLSRLVSTTRGFGITPILITQPALFGDAVDDVTQADLGRVAIEIYRPMNGHTAWRLLESYNEITRRIGRSNGVSVVDLAHALPKSSRYFYDYLHFGKEGAKAVAGIIAPAVCAVVRERSPEFATGECL